MMNVQEYNEMVAALRAQVGDRLVDQLIAAVQNAFGSVDHVVAYYAKGLVVFENGERWIYNWNRRYGRFYMGAQYKVVQ